MKKYEYMIALWDYSSAQRTIKLIKSVGEIEKHSYKGVFPPNFGDLDFLQLSDSLGDEGWEMFGVTSNGMGSYFVNRCFFKREIIES